MTTRGYRMSYTATNLVTFTLISEIYSHYPGRGYNYSSGSTLAALMNVQGLRGVALPPSALCICNGTRVECRGNSEEWRAIFARPLLRYRAERGEWFVRWSRSSVGRLRAEKRSCRHHHRQVNSNESCMAHIPLNTTANRDGENSQ